MASAADLPAEAHAAGLGEGGRTDYFDISVARSLGHDEADHAHGAL
jgi:hypothetical protein